MDQQAEVYYSGMGRKINVSIPLDLIPRRNQIDLLHALMEKIGFTKELRLQDVMPQVEVAWNAAISAYLREEE